MKARFPLLCAIIPACLVSPAWGIDPGWWSDRGVTNSSATSHLSPATVGQAKHMVAKALLELQSRLTAPQYAALEDAVGDVVDLTLPTTTPEFDKQRAVLVTGELKALAKPFYDQLRGINAAWVDSQMNLHGIRQLEPGTFTFSPYPWSAATTDDAHKAVASVGQLKAVFSLSFEIWGTAADDTDSDGVDDGTEADHGTSPYLTDSDGDGVDDGVDAYPLDPTRQTLPSATPGDTTKPVVALVAPANAVQLAGP